MNELGAVHIIVKGRVQGVGFRYYVQSLAHSLNFQGTVRNLYNGNVEIEAEGDKKIIQELIEELRNGYMSSNVSDIKIDWMPYNKMFNDFRIKFF